MLIGGMHSSLNRHQGLYHYPWQMKDNSLENYRLVFGLSARLDYLLVWIICSYARLDYLLVWIICSCARLDYLLMCSFGLSAHVLVWIICSCARLDYLLI